VSKSPASETSSSGASAASDGQVSKSVQEEQDEATIARMERSLEKSSVDDVVQKVQETIRQGLSGFVGSTSSPPTKKVLDSIEDLFRELNAPLQSVTVEQNALDPTVLDIEMKVPVFNPNYIRMKVTL